MTWQLPLPPLPLPSRKSFSSTSSSSSSSFTSHDPAPDSTLSSSLITFSLHLLSLVFVQGTDPTTTPSSESEAPKLPSSVNRSTTVYSLARYIANTTRIDNSQRITINKNIIPLPIHSLPQSKVKKRALESRAAARRLLAISPGLDPSPHITASFNLKPLIVLPSPAAATHLDGLRKFLVSQQRDRRSLPPATPPFSTSLYILRKSAHTILHCLCLCPRGFTAAT